MNTKKVLCTVLVVIIACLVLSACGGTKILGYEDLKVSLEEKGYSVELFTEDNILSEYGFDVVDKDDKDFMPKSLLDLVPMHLNSVDIVAVVSATKGDDNILVFYFNAASSAKNSYNKLVKEMEDFNKKMDTEKKEDKKIAIPEARNFEGKLFYFGTKNAETDIKG